MSEQIEAGAAVTQLNKVLVDSVKRIRHFAIGSCDMPLETRLKCIAKECEASLSKFDADWREAQDAAKQASFH